MLNFPNELLKSTQFKFKTFPNFPGERLGLPRRHHPVLLRLHRRLHGGRLAAGSYAETRQQQQQQGGVQASQVNIEGKSHVL